MIRRRRLALWIAASLNGCVRRLHGIYVTLYFVLARAVNLFAFGVKPNLSIWVGGAFIVTGGLVMTFWRF